VIVNEWADRFRSDECWLSVSAHTHKEDGHLEKAHVPRRDTHINTCRARCAASSKLQQAPATTQDTGSLMNVYKRTGAQEMLAPKPCQHSHAPAAVSAPRMHAYSRNKATCTHMQDTESHTTW